MNNSVQLLGTYGGDVEHALSAWTSTYRDLTDEKRARIPALLRKLATEGHHTPFEKSTLHFLVRVDTATHIHLLKHRIGVSINAESARYKELKHDGGYVPSDWTSSSGMSSEQCDKLRALDEWAEKLAVHLEKSQALYHKGLEELTPLLGRARAKESARFFLPYATQVTMDVSFNARSFAHFYKLRASEHAQKEIREVAEEMARLVLEVEGNPFRDSFAFLGINPPPRR